MRAPLLLLFALACSSGEGPPDTPTVATAESPELEIPATDDSEENDEFAPEPNPGERMLDPATGFAEGCSTDADCVIATDPCARASAVHRERQQAFQDQFRGRRYRCARHEYPADPVAYCRDSRCVGIIP